MLSVFRFRARGGASLASYTGSAAKALLPEGVVVSTTDSPSLDPVSLRSDLSAWLRFRFFVGLVFAVMVMAYIPQFMIAKASYTVVGYFRGEDFQIFYF